ncbi:MAG TPA: galactose oxidase-like domain-containing protein [Gemmatimonadales bacterium]|nr:galactose oxidase-like domain-containing protein [Gemmatimonadales bacterium]
MTRFWQFRSWALAGLLALSVLRCGSNVEPTTASDIAPVSGDGQTGIVGQVLPAPLVVEVTDASGNAVPGQTVQWEAAGGGSVSSQAVKTGSDGRASVDRVLGTTPGEQTTTATVAGLDGSPVTFVATAVEGNPDPVIVITTNPPVAALTGEVFDPAVQPVVSVTDGGNPVTGQEVTASIASGGGTLEGKTTAITDANGVARFADLGISGTGDQTIEFTAGTASVTSSPVSLSALPPEATEGKWGPVVNWDIVPLHMSLLPTGKIVAWGKTEISDTMGMPRVWDPAAGPPSGARMQDTDSMLFCAGHTLMADGTLMVAGGHLQDDRGTAETNFFSRDGAFSKGPPMAHARWYPTLTTLPDGRVLTMGGRDETGAQVTTPEIWENGSWVELPGAGTYVTPYYPRNFVAPNGLIFYAGERIRSRWFSVDESSADGRGRWTDGPLHIYQFNRDYGSAVMYDTGKILYVGGGGMKNWGGGTWPDAKTDVPTGTAETIDLNRSSATWQSTGSMAFRRRHMNATVLPDGQVLATGGTSGGGTSILTNIDPALAVHEAEIWNPATGQWTTLARNNTNIMRLYHSVSLLLPDGTVLNGASGDAMTVGPGGAIIPVPPERNHEIFSPPYLFKGARPTISSVSATSVGYGQTFRVATPNAAQISTVRWIRLGSVTHAFDASARANTLTFTVNGGDVEVTAPASPNLAPPGHYLLFILNRNGIPSAGKVIQVQ